MTFYIPQHSPYVRFTIRVSSFFLSLFLSFFLSFSLSLILSLFLLFSLFISFLQHQQLLRGFLSIAGLFSKHGLLPPSLPPSLPLSLTFFLPHPFSTQSTGYSTTTTGRATTTISPNLSWAHLLCI